MKFKFQFYGLNGKVTNVLKNGFSFSEIVILTKKSDSSISSKIICYWFIGPMVFRQSITVRSLRKTVRNLIKSSKNSYQYKNSNFQVQLIRFENKTHRHVH